MMMCHQHDMVSFASSMPTRAQQLGNLQVQQKQQDVAVLMKHVDDGTQHSHALHMSCSVR